MNKKTFAALVILASLVGLLSFACEEKESNPVTDSGVRNSPATPPEAVAGVAVQGRLERTGSGGLVLAAGGERYDLNAAPDLDDLIGSQVKVTGTVTPDGALTVAQVVPVPEALYSRDTDSNEFGSNAADESTTDIKETSHDN